MFKAIVYGKTKSAILKIAGSMLVLMFTMVLSLGQALAHDNGGIRWDYKRHHQPQACAQTTTAVFTACNQAAMEDYNLALGNCYNLSDTKDQKECFKEAKIDLKDANAECSDQREARQEVCRELGNGPYDPDLDPLDFSSDITNAYFPLLQGTTSIYHALDTDGTTVLQTIVVTVGDTTTIDGFPCRQVTDKVWDGTDTNPLTGRLLEDTIDWYSQSLVDGSVWYFGESTIAYEYDENGNPTPSDEGTWKAGDEGGSKPGIIMPGVPGDQINELYRQEFSLGNAEDLGRVIRIEPSVTVPAGTFENCLHTQDSTPLEPDVIEDKYYAPNVGLILTIDPDETREELQP